ncbi:MAG: helix-turn-helix domain-containing protein [Candidatus Dormibacteria bacterium]
MRLPEYSRWLLVEREGWTVAATAGVSRETACRWRSRWEAERGKGRCDRSSRRWRSPRRCGRMPGNCPGTRTALAAPSTTPSPGSRDTPQAAGPRAPAASPSGPSASPAPGNASPPLPPPPALPSASSNETPAPAPTRSNHGIAGLANSSNLPQTAMGASSDLDSTPKAGQGALLFCSPPGLRSCPGTSALLVISSLHYS